MLGCTWGCESIAASVLPSHCPCSSWTSAGLLFSKNALRTDHKWGEVWCWGLGAWASPTIKHSKSPGPVVDGRSAGALTWAGGAGLVDPCVSSEELPGAAALALGAKNKGGDPQERCLWSSTSGHSPTHPVPCCRSEAAPWCTGAGVQPLGGQLGVAGLALRTARPYSHHFNKEMIKRGWGGGGRKTQNICFTSNRGRFLCLQGMCKSRRAGRCT